MFIWILIIILVQQIINFFIFWSLKIKFYISYVLQQHGFSLIIVKKNLFQ